MAQEKHWRKYTLHPEHIALWTGNPQDVLSQDEVLLAGCLHSLDNIHMDEKHLLNMGREVLQDAALNEVSKGTKMALWGGSTHRKAVRQAIQSAGNKTNLPAPVKGWRLTPMALELAEATRQCREKLLSRPKGTSIEIFRLRDQQSVEFRTELQKAIGIALEQHGAGRNNG